MAVELLGEGPVLVERRNADQRSIRLGLRLRPDGDRARLLVEPRETRRTRHFARDRAGHVAGLDQPVHEPAALLAAGDLIQQSGDPVQLVRLHRMPLPVRAAA